MKKLDKEKCIKIFKIILIIIWMTIVFMFSNENGTESSNTSRKVTVAVVQTLSDKTEEENEPIIQIVEKIVRKLAHYTIYTIGGMLIINYLYTIDKNLKQKVLYSIALGGGYAITDEIHQFFVSDRSARIFDVGIDTLGVITGIAIYLVIRKVMDTAKSKIQE